MPRIPKKLLQTEKQLGELARPPVADAASPSLTERALEPGTDPLQRPRGEYRNLNIDRLDTPEDVDRLLDDVSYETQNAGYRPQSFEEVAEGAAKLPPDAKLIGGKPADHIAGNPEMLLKARQTLVSSAQRVQAQAKDIARRQRTGDVSDRELLDFRRTLERHRVLQSGVQGQIRQTARALSALRIPAGDVGDEVVIEALQAAGGRDTLIAHAKRFSNAKDLGDVSEMVNKGFLAKSADALMHIRLMGLLSGPTTHVKNVTGNFLANAMSIPERMAGGAVGLMRAQKRKILHQVPDAERVYAGEAWQMAIGDFYAVADGIRMAGRAMRSGESQFGPTKVEGAEFADLHDPISSAAFNVDPSSGLGRSLDYLGATVSMPGRALTASDDFFKTLSFNKELRAQAYRVATSEGLTGAARKERIDQIIGGLDEDAIIRNFDGTDDAVMQEALKAEDAIIRNAYLKAYRQSQYETFTDPLESGVAKAVGEAHRADGGWGRAFRFVVPFYKTIANLASYAVERSPLAPIAPKWMDDYRAGGPRRDMALARWGLGTAAAGYFMSQVQNGKITGAGPSDPTQRSNWNDAGFQPYSVWSEEDQEWVSYQGLEPMTTMIGAIAGAFDAAMYTNDPQSAADMAYGVAGAFSESLMDQTFLIGLSDTIEVLSSGEANKMRRLMAREAATVIVPYSSAIRTVTRSVDDTKRDTWTEPFIGLSNEIAKMMPGLSKNLPPRLNMWGEEVRWDERFGPDWLSPFYSKSYSNDKATQEIAVQGVELNKPPSTLNIHGKAVDLYTLPHPKGPGWAYVEWSRMLGNARYRVLSEVVNTQAYDNLPDAQAGWDDESSRKGLLMSKLPEARKQAFAQFKAKFADEIVAVLQNPGIDTITPPSPPNMRRVTDERVRIQ